MTTETAEVVIIGAGVMGASLAFHLTRLGVRDVLLLEKSSIGAGASSSPRTSGTQAIDIGALPSTWWETDVSRASIR